MCLGDVSYLLHKAEGRPREPHRLLNKSTEINLVLIIY